MKVDLGQCAACGAKNSKYVESCYKCGADLPWAPGYVAPKNATPQPTTPQPVAPSAGDAKTVVMPPANVAPTNSAPANAPRIEPVADAATVAERARRDVKVPAWAIGVGGLGLVVLGMGLWALFGNKPAPIAPAIAPTPIGTPIATAPALAPIAPAATAQPTAAPATEATAAPTVTAPVVAPTVAANPAISATAAPVKGVAIEPENGPNFDELYANLTTGTPQQQALYWDSVTGQKINWRGEFVSLGSALEGPLVVNCKNAKGTLQVTISLDVTTPQIVPDYTAKQSVPFSGILQSRADGSIAVKDGRVG